MTAAGTGTEGTTVAIVVPYHYALVRTKSIWSCVIVLIINCTEFIGCQVDVECSDVKLDV
jgi:hypothetical protein